MKAGPVARLSIAFTLALAILLPRVSAAALLNQVQQAFAGTTFPSLGQQIGHALGLDAPLTYSVAPESPPRGAPLAATALLPVQQPIAHPFADAFQFWSTIVASIDSLAHEFATTFIPHQSQLTDSTNPHGSNNLNAPPVARNAFEAAVGAALPNTTTSSQTNSEATSYPTTQSPFVNSAVLNTPASSNSAVSSTPTATIQSASFTQRTIIGQVPTNTANFVTPNQFDALSNRLNNLASIVGSVAALLPSLSQQPQTTPVPQQIAGDGNPEAIGAGAAIDQLSNVTINNPSITGLSVSDIPNLSGSYLSLNGGTLTGAFVDSGTASSSFTGALGIGTTSPSDVLAVNGPIYLANVTPSATTNRLYSNAGSLYWNGSLLGGGSVGNWTTDGANVWRTGGNVGIGTTSPSQALSVNGNAAISGGLSFESNATSTLTDIQGTSLGSWVPRLWELADGTSLNPITKSGATFEISRTEAVASTTCNGNNVDDSCNAGLLVESNSAAAAASSSQQTVAIDAVATGEPIATDVLGLSAIGDVIGAGTGIGTGAYLEGRRDTATGWAKGVEVRVSNITSKPGTYNASGESDTQGIWVTTNSYPAPEPSGAGLSFGGINGSEFITGIGFTTNSIASTSIRDDSSASTSIQINGTHTYGLLIGPSAGGVGIGTLAPSYPLDVSGFINTSGNYGYKQAGNTILYATSTGFDTFVGQSAGANIFTIATSSSLTSGIENTVLGYQALQNSTSSQNVAIGYQALQGNAIASDNSGNQNVAVGLLALKNNTSGSQNDAIGFEAMSLNTSGANDVGVGTFALGSNTTGGNNVAVGRNALIDDQTGFNDTAVGGWAGQGVVSNSFSNDSLFGYQSGFALSTGSRNVFLGTNVGSTTATGNNNIALGYDLALPSTNGSNQLDIGNLIFGTGINGEGTNVSIGNIGIGTTTPGSLFSVGNTNGINFATATSTFSTTGGINLGAGCFAISGNCLSLSSFGGTLGASSGGTGSTTLSGILVGNGASSVQTATLGGSLSLSGSTLQDAWTLSGSNLYNSSATNVGIDNISPSYALDIGGFINTGANYGYKQAGNTILYATSTGFDTFVGQSAGANIFTIATSSSLTSGIENTVLGYQALQNSTSSQNVAIGYQALRGSGSASDSSGFQNTAVGYQALTSDTKGTENTGLGFEDLLNNTSGSVNTAVGYQILTQNTSGANNVGVGVFALGNNTTGGQNVAVGRNALLDEQAGFSNTAIGYEAGQGVSSNSFSNDSLFGFESGVALTTGANNVFLGYEAASSTATGANNIVIGSGNGLGLDLPSFNGSNQLDIGNFVYATGLTGSLNTVSSGLIGIGTTTPYAALEVWGPDTASTTAFLISNSASTTEFAVYDTGNATLAGGLTQNSDQRLKTNIQSLNGSSALAAIDALNPVTFNWIDPNQGTTPQLGFIAQQVQSIFPNLVSTTSPTALTPNGTLSLNYIGLISPIISAIQALSSEIASIENTITSFAQSITTHILTGDDVTANNELCVGSTCVTPAQFQAMVAATNQWSVSQSSQLGNSSGQSTATASSSSDSSAIPPVLQVNGDNPAIVQVGATYTDLGAQITGPQADLNLGIQAIVDGGATTTIGAVEISTSQPGTHTIEYVATDQNGLEATATRTVNVIAPTASPQSPAATSTNPTADNSGDTASSTEATTTAQ